MAVSEMRKSHLPEQHSKAAGWTASQINHTITHTLCYALDPEGTLVPFQEQSDLGVCDKSTPVDVNCVRKFSALIIENQLLHRHLAHEAQSWTLHTLAAQFTNVFCI